MAWTWPQWVQAPHPKPIWHRSSTLCQSHRSMVLKGKDFGSKRFGASA
jgi:hypothetical protein